MSAKLHVLRRGARLPEDLLAIARKERTRTASIQAIGGVERLRLAYYNRRTKKYEHKDFAEQMEAMSILGNVANMEGEPFLHLHGTFGRRDMSVVGGHIMTARIFPLLEVVISPTRNSAVRVFDEATKLNVLKIQ